MNTAPAIHCLHDALVPLTELREHPRNPNRHSQKQSDLLATIIQNTGWRNPITVSRRSGFIVSGHGRLYAARTLRLREAPVQYQDFATDEEELSHLLADNRLAEFSQRDDAALAGILSDLKAEGSSIVFTGYDDLVMTKLLAKLGSDKGSGPAEEPAPDPNAALAAKWNTAFGQVWDLGPHRLVIGDAASPASWDLMMPAGETGHLVFVDPPYGVDYVDSKGRSVEGDKLQRDDLAALIRASLDQAVQRTVADAPFYIWHASSTRDDSSYAMKAVGLVERQYLTWVKEGFVLGHEDFHWQTEHAFYACREGSAPRFYGDRSQSTSWRISGQDPAAGVLVNKEGIHLTDGHGRHLLVKECPPPKAAKLRHFRIAAGETILLQPHEGTTAWCVSRDPTAEYIHPNQKPVALAEKGLILSSQPGDIVVDMFAGSGSTMIAAEQLGRRARIMEKCPLKAAAIVERWSRISPKACRLAA